MICTPPANPATGPAGVSTVTSSRLLTRTISEPSSDVYRGRVRRVLMDLSYCTYGVFSWSEYTRYMRMFVPCPASLAVALHSCRAIIFVARRGGRQDQLQQRCQDLPVSHSSPVQGAFIYYQSDH